MRVFFSFLLHLLVVLILTVLTQIGGLIYLSVLVLAKFLNQSRVVFIGLFLVLYAVATFVIIPSVAPFFGRTALPVSGNLQPLNFITCLLNRHYVTPELSNQIVAMANRMEEKYDGTSINYLDANFPFYNGFPLFPHLSHNDGKKLDLAFFYKKDGERVDDAPSFIGYGVFEDPSEGEPDYPTDCKEKGYWQYGLLSFLIPQWNKDTYQVDEERTKYLLKLLANDQLTSKIFIEPHLKQRWRLNRFDKIRYHGCQAVRHDDHIHTQIQ